MVCGQEQHGMVTITWRADHVRHEMITSVVVSDDHVRGDRWPIRQGNAQTERSLYIYKEACTASSYTVSAHLSCSNARRP